MPRALQWEKVPKGARSSVCRGEGCGREIYWIERAGVGRQPLPELRRVGGLLTKLAYRFAPLPRQWPGRSRPAGWRPSPSKFKGHAWGRVERELLNELEHLQAKDIVISLDLVGPGNLRDDGGLRADARPVTSRVVLSFTRGDAGVRLTFPCDTYASWEDNLWAIRLTLENLRAIDRYGVTQGDQQYVGFAALPPGKRDEMTIDDAIALLAEHGDAGGIDLLVAPGWMVDAVQKRARAASHPDAGGSDDLFQRIEKAARIIADARKA